MATIPTAAATLTNRRILSIQDAQCLLKRCEKLIRLPLRQTIARIGAVVDKHNERLTEGFGRPLLWIVSYAKAGHIRASYSSTLAAVPVLDASGAVCARSWPS